MRADVYAVVDLPYAAVSTALAGPAHWCEVLILHLNTEFCALVSGAGGNVLDTSIGRRYDQAIQDAYRVEFDLHSAAAQPDYFDVRLDAKSGPGGTNGYHIRIEALANADGKTFVHVENSFGYDLFAWAAIKAYLMTAGRDKVGFSVADAAAPAQAGAPAQTVYIGGVRGLVERNAMRYFIAVQAYLDALALPPAEQFERRLHRWFADAERYPRQLHEIDEATYLEMKRMEAARQRRPDAP